MQLMQYCTLATRNFIEGSGKKRFLFLPKSMTAKQLHQLLFEIFGQKLNVLNYEEKIIN